MTQALIIDVAFDLICPWCLIGKRNLDCAVQLMRERHPDSTVNVRWHGVQLLPDIPEAGVPFAEFYEQRLGGKEAVRTRQAQVNAAAANAGLAIHLERIKTMPNTGKAHRLLSYAANSSGPAQYAALYDQLLERLFAAYFIHGENIGDTATLTHIAQSVGLNTDNLATWLAVSHQPTNEELARAGVPFFMFNQRHSVAGAQSPTHLLYGMRTVINEGLDHDTPISTAAWH